MHTERKRRSFSAKERKKGDCFVLYSRLVAEGDELAPREVLRRRRHFVGRPLALPLQLPPDLVQGPPAHLAGSCGVNGLNS